MHIAICSISRSARGDADRRSSWSISRPRRAPPRRPRRRRTPKQPEKVAQNRAAAQARAAETGAAASRRRPAAADRRRRRHPRRRPPPAPPAPKPPEPKPEPPKPDAAQARAEAGAAQAEADDAVVRRAVEEPGQARAASNDQPDKTKPTPPAPRTPHRSRSRRWARSFRRARSISCGSRSSTAGTCPPARATRSDLTPEFRVHMNPDGTVRAAELHEHRSARRSVLPGRRRQRLRALLNPTCQPLKLPPDKYDQWQTFTITFDPKDMT